MGVMPIMILIMGVGIKRGGGGRRGRALINPISILGFDFELSQL